MLILALDEGDGIVIGRDTIVRMLGRRHGHYCVGISAPAETPIVRMELLSPEQRRDVLRLASKGHRT